ncbi:MAG: hypothetical protein KUG64_10255 [Cycloclasticus sp.]|nr:hypothetical protein [Cycloclasticus sp.]
MATADKEDIKLRNRSNPPLTTKGSEFSWNEVDDNFITAFNQFVALSNSSNVDAYSAATTYSTNAYVSYSNQLYKMIAVADVIDITPDSDPATWEKVYASDLVQAPSGVRSFKKLITSAEVLQLSSTPINLIMAAGADTAIVLLNATATVMFETGSPAGIPYAGNLNLLFGYAGGSEVLFKAEEILATDIKQTLPLSPFVDPSYGKSSDYITENKNFTVTMSSDPTSGDSDVLIQGTYMIIDLV